TDVGGGFSIGLGGLGFTMGVAGSWLLFSGLVGAWLASVLLVPRIKALADREGWLSYGDFLEYRFDRKVRVLAAMIAGLGYAAFTGSQVLAGAKLAAVVFEVDLDFAIWCMAAVVLAYTAAGGLAAVMFTDAIQWLVLLFGLLCFALPAALSAAGGLEGLRATLPADHLDLFAVSAGEFTLWMFTIVPIWFVANTLYQRIYAARDTATAQRAFLYAGLLEWPLIAFAGATLGMLARALYPEVEPETGLPLLIREVLPVGVTGIVLAAYFSAILSTADSCLLASVGHIVCDIRPALRSAPAPQGSVDLFSQGNVVRIATLFVGVVAVLVARHAPGVLSAVLLAYGFMVAGLTAPTLAALFWPAAGARAAFAAILTGGGLVLGLPALKAAWPQAARTADGSALFDAPGGFLFSTLLSAEPMIVALAASTIILIVFTVLTKKISGGPAGLDDTYAR
ncbi:MAG: sodium:solute symporter family protein, partial [Leptospirales bacterium]